MQSTPSSFYLTVIMFLRVYWLNLLLKATILPTETSWKPSQDWRISNTIWVLGG